MSEYATREEFNSLGQRISVVEQTNSGQNAKIDSMCHTLDRFQNAMDNCKKDRRAEVETVKTDITKALDEIKSDNKESNKSVQTLTLRVGIVMGFVQVIIIVISLLKG